MSYTFYWWHLLVAGGAAFIVWALCALYQTAKRDIAARKAWAQYVRLHPDEEGYK